MMSIKSLHGTAVTASVVGMHGVEKVTSMQWITPERDYLFEGEKCVVPREVAIGGSTKSTLRPAKFYLIDENGVVKTAYSQPLEYGIDNEFGVTDIHVVVGSELLAYHWKEFWGPGRPPDQLSSKVLLTDLCPVAQDELPFDPQPIIAGFENG
jgi:hypothetical protein